MTPGVVLSASLLASLARPSTWILGLLGFLVRGGFLVVLAPIVVVPSAVGLANVIAPTLTSMVFGGLSLEIVALLVGGVVVVAAWLVLGGLLAAAVEAEAAELIVDDEDLTSIRRSGLAPRILLARAITATPLAVALSVGSLRVVAVAYRELTVPSEVAVPVAVRIIRGAPDAVAAIILAWVVAEVLGALAARRVTLLGEGPVDAVLHAMGHAIRHPLRTVLAFGVPLFALGAVIVPSGAAAALTWDAIRDAIANDAGPLAVGGLLVAFIGLWGGGLVLIGMVTAWRGAAWTIEVARTFGAPWTALPGEWTTTTGAATLHDLRSPGADPDPR